MFLVHFSPRLLFFLRFLGSRTKTKKDWNRADSLIPTKTKNDKNRSKNEIATQQTATMTMFVGLVCLYTFTFSPNNNYQKKKWPWRSPLAMKPITEGEGIVYQHMWNSNGHLTGGHLSASALSFLSWERCGSSFLRNRLEARIEILRNLQWFSERRSYSCDYC